jgi:hypothetical protein
MMAGGKSDGDGVEGDDLGTAAAVALGGRFGPGGERNGFGPARHGLVPGGVDRWCGVLHTAMV